VNGKYSTATFTPNADKSPAFVVIGKANNTLAGIRDTINAANAGVTASIINDGKRLAVPPRARAEQYGRGQHPAHSHDGDSAIGALLGYDRAHAELKQTQMGQNAELSSMASASPPAPMRSSARFQGVTLNLAKPTAADSSVGVTIQHTTTASPRHSALGEGL